MKKRLAVGAAVLAWAAVAAAQPAPYKMVTASERGTYIQIGRDIAKLVAPASEIELEVLPSAGSAENVQRLRYEPGVRLALVQSDVYQAFLDQADNGNADAGAMIKPLRVIMPLYNEEIYFMTRADAPFHFVHDIRDARINVGPLRSGTAMSATTIYKQLFGTAMPEARTSYLPNEEALVKLVVDKSVDVVVVVAGQPAKLLVDMKPEARKLVKLLKFDPANPLGAQALKTYFPATVRAANYPNLLAEDVPAVAVKAFLVTYDYRTAGSVQRLASLARSLCENFARLQAEGHPKWREVQLALPALGRGWAYYRPMERELRSCIAKSEAARAVPVCNQDTRILGLCK